MLKSFLEVIKMVQACDTKHKVAVAAAEDEEVLLAVKGMEEQCLANAILVGHEEKIKKIAESVGIDIEKFEIVHEPIPAKAALKAVSLVSTGKASIIMKGLVGTADFLKAVLDKEVGLRTGRVLSHVALFKFSDWDRLLMVTDAAMNITPGLNEKVQIINNALEVSKALGIEPAKVAPICAVETVNSDMNATLEAANLSKMAERGQIKGAIIDGPLALDNAISLEAAAHKGIKSSVAGQADILLMPQIEAGNVFYKAAVYLAKAEAAGVIVGAAAPVVLTSRADSYEAKINSLAISLLMAQKK